MRIYLSDLYHDHSRSTSVVPTNIGYVAAYAKAQAQDSIDIRLFKSPEALLKACNDAPPDILGLSNYMWNERLNAFVARRVKAANPDTLIVMGGPNVRTTEAEVGDFLRERPDVDQYILYAAELPFADIMTHALEHGTVSARSADIEGVIRLHNDEAVGKAFISDAKELDYIPSPYLTGLLDEFLDVGHTPLIETNRGCPFTCTFCVWGISALNKLKTFSMERVVDEMNYIADNFDKSPSWILADANFGIMPRDVEIAKLIRSMHDKTGSFENVNVWWSKTVNDRTVEIAKTLGKLCEAYVAFQSLDPEVLRLIKRSNISTEKLIEFKEDIEGHTNGAYTDILLGLPGETKQSHMASYYGALKLGFDQVGGGEVRLLPGSEMDEVRSRKEYGLKTKYRISEADVGLYDGDIVFELEEGVRATNWMSEEEMLDLRIIRALLYGALTVGELSPLNAVLLDNDINILEIFSKVVERRTPGTQFDAILKEFDEIARSEWIDSKEKAEAFYNAPENAQQLLKDPPVKLNFWLIGKLILDPVAYREFQAELTAVLADHFDDGVVSDLLAVCAERNYMTRYIAGDDATRISVPISDETEALLSGTEYMDGWARHDDGALHFTVLPKTAALIREGVSEGQHQTMIGMSRFLQQFRHRIYGIGVAPETTDTDDLRPVLQTEKMHAWDTA